MERSSLHPVVAERWDPQPKDPQYLFAIDLFDAIRAQAIDLAQTGPAKILDFGCGFSPYKTLFTAQEYKRADLTGVPDIDYDVTVPDSVPAARFDAVLSTQVLEHVADTHEYLCQCLRALRPGGRLILTTHGFYEQHACPNDYYRWTAHGLRIAAEKAGLKVETASKLTSGQRAAFFLIQRYIGLLGINRRDPVGFCFAILSRLTRLFLRPILNRWLDRQYPNCKRTDDDGPVHDIYIGLLLVASRPESGTSGEI